MSFITIETHNNHVKYPHSIKIKLKNLFRDYLEIYYKTTIHIVKDINYIQNLSTKFIYHFDEETQKSWLGYNYQKEAVVYAKNIIDLCSFMIDVIRHNIKFDTITIITDRSDVEILNLPFTIEYLSEDKIDIIQEYNFEGDYDEPSEIFF